jgi:hypothetical protein
VSHPLDRYPPTATVSERVVLGTSCAIALVALLLRWYWVAVLGGLGVAVAVYAQQVRETRARRRALRRLDERLASMPTADREAALDAFLDRFPVGGALQRQAFREEMERRADEVAGARS